MISNVVLPAVGQVGGDAARADVVGVHAQPGRLLEEGEDHFALTEAVDQHGGGAEVPAVGGHPQQVRRHPVQLAHQHADPGGARWRLDVQERLGRQGEDQLVVERRQVVHPGHVGGALDVGQLLALLLHAGVEVADDGLGAQDRLAVQLEHEAQHAVGRGVLGPHVDDRRLVVAALDVDVGRIHVAALGEAEDRAHLLAQLAGAGGGARPEALDALRRLRDQGLLLGRVAGGRLLGGLALVDLVGPVRVVVVAHRGPGASLNCTGTRPTP